MAIGPGKYDDILTEARRKAGARGAVLIVFEGGKGLGFSVQASPLDTLRLPDVLRNIASTIEGDVKKDFVELLRTSTPEPPI